MCYTELQDADERRSDYINALNYYLLTTTYNIVFCCNSGHDQIEQMFAEYKERLEFIMFEGNNYDKSIGKGYGEFEIIKYSLNNSIFLKNASFIIKITGRLIVENVRKSIIINNIILLNKKNSIYIDNPYAYKDRYDSRFFVAPISFFQYFTTSINNINDNNGYWFEHKLFDETILSGLYVFPFFLPMVIKGISGSTNIPYDSFSSLRMRKKIFIKYCILEETQTTNYCLKIRFLLAIGFAWFIGKIKSAYRVILKKS